jgi:hypothetical protein
VTGLPDPAGDAAVPVGAGGSTGLHAGDVAGGGLLPGTSPPLPGTEGRPHAAATASGTAAGTEVEHPASPSPDGGVALGRGPLVTTSLLQEALRRHGIRTAADPAGWLEARLRLRVDDAAALGRDTFVLHVTVDESRQVVVLTAAVADDVPAARWSTAFAACNQYNAQILGPRAYLHLGDQGWGGLRAGAILDVDSGMTATVSDVLRHFPQRALECMAWLHQEHGL